ncbi:MAG: acylphosphatase [Bacteroidota bacterium]
MAERSVQITVRGVVQGVNFRTSTRAKAEELMLSGIVRNEPDGSVYIEVAGPPEQIDKLIEWCKKGSPRSKVERVDVNECVVKQFNGFEIKRF